MTSRLAAEQVRFRSLQGKNLKGSVLVFVAIGLVPTDVEFLGEELRATEKEK